MVSQVRMLTWVTIKGTPPRLKLMVFNKVTASKFNLKLFKLVIKTIYCKPNGINDEKIWTKTAKQHFVHICF